MQRRVVNPWTWQDRYGFVQANEATAPERVLWCAGQTSVDEDGQVLHAGDMEAQALQAIANLETVLQEAGFTLADVVRLNTYVTDIDAYFAATDAIRARLDGAGCRIASTLLGISRLAFPGLMIEIEATAAR